MSALQQVTRDQSPVHLPDVFDTGVTGSSATGEVWGWVRLLGRSTDDIPLAQLFQQTDRDATDLSGLIPTGADFHWKIQFGRYAGSDYLAERWSDDLTEGQKAHLAISADRIDDHQLPHRIVLLGVRFDAKARQGDNHGVLAKLSRRIADARNPMRDGAAALRAAIERVDSWIGVMAESGLRARAATKTELAWSLARDVQGEPAWLPSEADFVGPGEVARLAPSRPEPTDDHITVLSDTGTRFLRILVPTAGEGGGFPASGLALPGGEWLKNLFVAGSEQDRNAPPVEVSIRGTNLSAGDAVKKLRSALNAARQQREEAASVGAVAPLAVDKAEEKLEGRIDDVQGGRANMVEDTPTFVVEAPTLELLNKRTHQVKHHYLGMGISLWEGHCIQDLLYKQLLLGDRTRVSEFVQLRPWTTLAGGWGHGGSTVGSNKPRARYLGVNVGSTPEPFRMRFTDASLEGKAGTTVATGTSGAGKSTGVCLALLMEVIWGGWGLLTDFKGDLAGIVPAARMFSVPVTEISTDKVAAGALDPFRYVPDPREAASFAVDFLMMLFRDPPSNAERLVRKAANAVADRPGKRDRSCHAIIQALLSSEDATARDIGEELADLAADPLARPVAGDPANTTQTLPTGPGLVYLRFADLRWPGTETPRNLWSAGSRLSVMLVQAGFAYATYMAGRVKGIAKSIALTELHLLTGYDFGRDYVGRLAKIGRALDVHEFLDTQEADEMTRIHGLLDQITTVLAFHVTRAKEAEAQARLMGLEPDAAFVAAQTAPIREGERDCLVLDRDGNLGRVAFDYMADEIKEALNTTPDRHAPVFEAEEEDVA